MKFVIITLLLALGQTSFADERITLEVKTAFCDALEYAMEHPEDFDNDIYRCKAGYTRTKCMEGRFRMYKSNFVSGSVKDVTCDCGAKLKRNAKGVLKGVIGGCA